MSSTSWSALGTTAVLAVTDPSSLRRAREIVAEELDRIDRACSRFRHDSEIVRLNSAGGKKTSLSPLLFEALTTALEAADATSGLVDPTVGRTLRLSGYDRTFTLVRQRDESFRPRFVQDPGWRTIELDPQERTATVPKGVELDLGATAKALAADRAAHSVFSATGAGTLVCLGGDGSIAGESPAGGWSIRLAEDHTAPLDSSGPAVSMVAGGFASSSTTVRRWTTGAGVLHHIVEPRTGRPASTHWRSATVSACSCVAANTASTAAIVLGESAVAWLADRRLPARLVRFDGVVLRVAGWPAEAL